MKKLYRTIFTSDKESVIHAKQFIGKKVKVYTLKNYISAENELTNKQDSDTHENDKIYIFSGVDENKDKGCYWLIEHNSENPQETAIFTDSIILVEEIDEREYYRPFTLVDKEQLQNVIVIERDTNFNYQLKVCDSDKALLFMINDNPVSPSELLERYVFEDGTPCGVYVENDDYLSA